MIGLGEFSTEVELEDGDVIDTATEEMRDLGYKFCLIEVQDEKGEIKSQRLRISVQHLA